MEKGAKVLGLVVFVAGVVMLGAVFLAALDMLRQSRATEITDIAKQLPREGFVLLARVLFLFLLGYVSSAVAARGIQLYEASPRETAAETPTTDSPKAATAPKSVEESPTTAPTE